MKLWPFGKKVSRHAMTAAAGESSILLRNTGFRMGMWVVLDDRVGILVRAYSDATVEVHLVDGDGATELVHPHIPIVALRQARFEEIPAARRGHLTPEQARQGGYL